MPRLRFPVPISIILFLALTFAGTYFVRRLILRRHFESALALRDEQTLCRLLHAWPCPVSPKGEDKFLFWDLAEWAGEDLAGELADCGFDPFIKGHVDDTPLHRAALHGNTPMARFLVAKGADVNARNGLERTPLHEALYGPNPAMSEIVQLLVRARAELDPKDTDGRTPLWHAASDEGSIPSLRILISAGADVNARDKWGNTPLGSAAYYLHPEAMPPLLDRGADANARNDEGKTVLTLARTSYPARVKAAGPKVQQKAIDLLLQHGAKE